MVFLIICMVFQITILVFLILFCFSNYLHGFLTIILFFLIICMVFQITILVFLIICMVLSNYYIGFSNYLRGFGNYYFLIIWGSWGLGSMGPRTMVSGNKFPFRFV